MTEMKEKSADYQSHHNLWELQMFEHKFVPIHHVGVKLSH